MYKPLRSIRGGVLHSLSDLSDSTPVAAIYGKDLSEPVLQRPHAHLFQQALGRASGITGLSEIHAILPFCSRHTGQILLP